MINLITNNPVALDSDDHKYPEGVYYDNNISYEFVKEVEQYFNKNFNLLDLGCAGGELVSRLVDKGYDKCVGLEGSDHILKLNEEMIQEVGFLPLGHENWKKYGNKNLFTCDVTKDFTILDENSLLQFDIITSWDVMEHFDPQQIEEFLEVSNKHLKPGGLFIAQIALFHSGRHAESKNTPNGLDYHKSVFTREIWCEKINKYFLQIDYPFNYGNRDSTYGKNWDKPNYLLYCGTKS